MQLRFEKIPDQAGRYALVDDDADVRIETGLILVEGTEDPWREEEP
ncbi:MAG: hypothetical protein QOI66_1477 [Myxococcales bacterium]|nr:hypothetical protein [Myxococcales bacterium]